MRGNVLWFWIVVSPDDLKIANEIKSDGWENRNDYFRTSLT